MAKHGRQKSRTSDPVYFAKKDTEEIGCKLMERIENYYDHIHETGRLELWLRSYEMYNNSYFRGARTSTAGEYDEYSVVNVNHYKNILQHMHVNTTSQRIAYEPQSTNTDAKSQGQTLLAVGLLDYYVKEKRMERNLKAADLDALLYGEGLVAMDWDATLGETVTYEFDEESGDYNPDQEIKEGDIVYANFTPNNVIRDFTKASWEQQNWKILREFKDKYELADKYPEYADRIISITETESRFRDRLGETDNFRFTDQIPVYTFYHDKCGLLPEGRMVRLLQDDLVLTDGPLPFSEVPIYRESCGEMDETSFGDTVAWDLLGIQEVIDTLYSVVVTNQKTFGVQCVISPRGAALDAGKLAEGLTHIEYSETPNGGKPEALNLLNTPAEVFQFIQQLEQLMETLSGVNSVARGNPEASLQSGAALALVHSMAIQFSQGQQESYTQLVEDVGTATINILKTYAKTKRVATITGKSNKQYLKHFTGDDIADVSRCTINVGNPLTRTTAGKVNLAEQLISHGLIKTPEEYLQVVQTGQLEPLVEGETAELMAIREENEGLASAGTEQDLSDGVIAVLTDDHNLHIREHKSVLASLESRNNPAIVEVTLAHIQEHINMLMDPANAPLFAVLGQQGLAELGGQPGGVGEALGPIPGEEGGAQQPNMPQLPGAEGSGGTYNATTGEMNPEAM